VYDNNPQHINPAGPDHDDDPTPPTHPQGPRALAEAQVSEIVTVGLSNTSQSSEASPTCNHLHYGDEKDPNVNLDCPWAPLMTDYETAINTADHPLAAKEIGEILSSEHLQIGIDKLDFMTEPLYMHEQARWEFDTTTVRNDHQPGVEYRTSLILSGGQLIRLYCREPQENAPIFLSVTFNPSQNRSLATIDQALKIGEEAWDAISDLFVLPGTFHTARINRLDISADITPIADLRGVLNALNHVTPRPRWKRTNVESTGATGGITVSHSTKTFGAITVYDKSAQASLDTPTIRFEAKLYKGARKKFDLQHVHQINETSARKAFDHFVDPFRLALLRQLDLSAAINQFCERRTIEAIGFLCCSTNGIPLTPSRERTYLLRRIIKTLGVNSIDELRAA
jgi:hypothetical protein